MTEPVTVSQAIGHLRESSDTADIAELPRYITAARQAVEHYLNASIVNQTRVLRLGRFPIGAIKLPNGPVVSVTSIGYVDIDGNNQTVASLLLAQDTIAPAYNENWPDTRDQIGAVTITYTAGMQTAESADIADQDITAAILITLTDLWDNRSAQIVGSIMTVNKTVERMMHFHRRNLGT